jgi:Mn2+/Fe2+ NRAMP family transporter
MGKLFEIALGIVTSVGGFLEIGSIATAAQAGAVFGFRLLWAIVLGGLCIIFLVEMAGRFAAVSKHTIVDATRERFGFNLFLIPFAAVLLVNLLVLAAEIGGVCIALELATGIALRWWVLPVMLAGWLLLWRGSFGIIEKGVSLLGLITVVFIVAAVQLRPEPAALAQGLLPASPGHDTAHYWALAVNILGASISPYLFHFYSAGAIEDEWDESYLGANRAIAGIGMGFGSAISVAVLIVAALILQPMGLRADQYQQLPLMLTQVFGTPGLYLFAAALGIACFGATLEITLATAYLVAQGFGWNWGENQRPKQAARFSLAYTVIIVVGGAIILAGINPLNLTNVSMGLTAVSLPVAVIPFLVLMNDPRYMDDRCNGWIGNLVVVAITALSFLLAIVALPLQIVGGS